VLRQCFARRLLVAARRPAQWLRGRS
jgi:hypothetical protein